MSRAITIVLAALVSLTITPTRGTAQGIDRAATGSHEERVEGIYAVLFKDIHLGKAEQVEAKHLISQCQTAQVALVSSRKATRENLAVLQVQRDSGLRALIEDAADRALFDARAKRMMPKG